MFPIILLGIFSFVSTRAMIPRINESNVVDNLIANGNEFIISNGFRNMSLPDVANENFFTKRLFTSGFVHDLASIKRIGNANMTKKSRGSMTEFSVEAIIGLETLVADYQYNINFLWVFKTSGHMTFRVKKNSARAKMELIADKTDGSCALMSKDLDVILLDDIDVDIEEGGFLSKIVAIFVKFNLRYNIPNIIKIVNSCLDEFNDKYPITKNLEKYVCKYFF